MRCCSALGGGTTVGGIGLPNLGALGGNVADVCTQIAKKAPADQGGTRPARCERRPGQRRHVRYRAHRHRRRPGTGSGSTGSGASGSGLTGQLPIGSLVGGS